MYHIFFYNKRDLKYIYVCLEFTKNNLICLTNKMKNKKYHTVGRFLKYKIVERGKIGTFNTHKHERSLSLGNMHCNKEWRG